MSDITTPDRVRGHLGAATIREKLAALPLRPVLAALGLVALASGLAWQRDWLVAVGVAPILVSVAPCALMCALGLCMMNAKGGAGDAEPRDPRTCRMKARPSFHYPTITTEEVTMLKSYVLIAGLVGALAAGLP